METIVNQPEAGVWLVSAAYFAISAVAVSSGALLLLHFLSPEFAPSWRMVSEYANGENSRLLTVVFIGWALSSFSLTAALWPLSESWLGKAGLILLVLGGIGQTMGALFDINHKLHGPAAMIGIPSLCLAAVVITLAMARRSDIVAPPVWFAHLPWLAFALMIGAFVLFLSTLKSVGIDISAQSRPLSELPEGVSGYLGWANRLLFAVSYLWTVLAALAAIQAHR